MTTTERRSDHQHTSEGVWMWVTLLIFAALVTSWLPALDLSLGDDHQGRILGRYVLHAENFLEKGWTGSDLGAAWDPYSSAPYAHHPPLPQFVHILVGWMQGATTAFSARAIGTVTGAMALGALIVLVRKLTSSWLAVVASLAGIAISGYFWFFGRGSLSLLFPVAYFLVRAHALDSDTNRWLAGLGAIGLMGALESWPTVLIVGLVALYDLLKGNPRAAIATAVGVAIGLVMDFWWIESAAGIESLVSHVEARADRANYGVLEWVARQGGLYLRFESLPVFALTAIALAAGLRDSRFRPLVASSFVMVVVYAVVFHQNAWVHEYWNWRIVLVLALGMGAIGDKIAEGLPLSSLWLTGLILVVLSLAMVPVLRLRSDLGFNW